MGDGVLLARVCGAESSPVSVRMAEGFSFFLLGVPVVVPDWVVSPKAAIKSNASCSCLGGAAAAFSTNIASNGFAREDMSGIPV